MIVVWGVCWLRQAKRLKVMNRQLVAALLKEDTKRARGLVELGADPNTPLYPPETISIGWMINEALHRHSPVTTAFLQACGTGYGWSSDSIAALRHYPDDPVLVKTMLDHGAHLNAVSDYQQSALLGAVASYHIHVAELLLKCGISVDAKDQAGQTPLMWACMDNEPDMVHLLLAHGAKVSIRDNDGNYALFYSVWSGGNANVIRQLLALGANPTVRNKMGQSALTWGASSRETITLLRSGLR